MTALLKGNIEGINHFYSSRPIFIDIDQEKSAIAVFLDEIEVDEISLCHHQWQSTLNIAIYLKTAVGEDELDDVAEQIQNLMAQAIEKDNLAYLISEIHLSGYNYEQDATNRTWFVANVRYQITYED
ncbi:putative minor tail protein [Rodentibacter pneumotropicus]|uniref:Putative minor tail protein n=1 Tax=Rodentibacter pneumotropicus TaxID=758 RepID=A0A448MNW0_9PAST|nr:putative minor tail protein [Rodentibacter pneumotropicus]